MLGFVLSCRDPDEAGVLSKEVLDCLQTGGYTTTTAAFDKE